MQEKMKQNLLKVNVFLRMMDTKKVQESEIYNINSMLYAIGGAVSLFLGISITMLF